MTFFERLGRAFGHCWVCGKPTRSHVVGTRLQCHDCREAGQFPALADGGEDLRERIAEHVRLNPDDPAPAIIGAVDALSPADRALVEAVLDGGDCDDISPQGADAVDDIAENDHDEPEPEPAIEHDGPWSEADFSAPETGAYPPEQLEREQWMGRAGESGKQPFAPWADRDHPEAAADEDARWKWGLEENYVDGATVAMAEDDPRLDGRVFIQHDDDPFAFVDGDDVRDPETGDVHPGFVAILERLGATYADVSTSGTGVHANYRGALPEGVKQATFAIDDDPWGANDEIPEVEIYDGKHVCVQTGAHVPGTPLEVRAWDDDAIEAILDEHDQLRDQPVADPAGERKAFDGDDYEPEATSADETATDVRDIFDALDRLDCRRVAERTIVARWNDSASTSDGKRAFAPTWGPGANGTANVVDHDLWQDTGGGGYGGAVTMALIDLGDLGPGSATPRVSGKQWWRGVEHLRELGFDVPEYQPTTDETESVAILPDSEQARATAEGWDWTADERTEELTIDAVRERTVETIVEAIDGANDVLVEALPTSGKSYGSVLAAAETDQPVTLLTGRGRKEQYEQFREWCDEHGLTHYTLPAFTRDCDSANGEHGQEWADRAMSWYSRGATPQDIHKNAEYELGEPLPCQRHEGQQCAYASKWDFDPDDVDVLIGHYAHAHKQKVTKGRTVIVDEFPGGAYETSLDHLLEGAVTTFLQREDAIPYEDYTDLIEHRDDDARRGEALLWFENRDDALERDVEQVFASTAGHAAAPLAVYTILAGEDLGNGFERATLDRGVGLYDREQGTVWLLQPPTETYDRCTIALDGTPTPEMWNRTIGARLDHRPVLNEAERREYVRDVLNLQVVRTTDAVKSYSPKASEARKRVSVRQDAALLEAIAGEHGQRPALITTARAEDVYRNEGITELVDDVQHYGNVLGSNQLGEQRLGAVIGSRNFGPNYVKKWAAYLDSTAEPTFPSPENDFTPTDYGNVGNKIRTHMREHETLQAVMRFGRDGNGAVVYCHTDTLPLWFPYAGEGAVVDTWSDGTRQVLAALEELDSEPRTDAVAAHPAVEIGERQVLNVLETLRDRGVLRRSQDPEDGRAVVWQTDGLHRVGEHGEVELDSVTVDALDDDEVDEVLRTTTYTWDFVNRPGGAATTGGGGGASTVTGESPASNVGDRPPDPAD